MPASKSDGGRAPDALDCQRRLLGANSLYMLCNPVRLNLLMLSGFREPDLRLGVKASDVMQAFYRAFQAFQVTQKNLGDFLTFGGNSYGELKLRINNPFPGANRIDITPGALLVELNPMQGQRTGWQGIKDQLQLCEDTLGAALNDVEISERVLRANMWAACEGGSAAVDAFLRERGNAALKLDQGPYADWQKEFTFQFVGLNASKATRVGLMLQRSTVVGDLFVQFDHTYYGSPGGAKRVKEQVEEAESELETMTQHIGLKLEKGNVGRP
jgi:hypothetical protein